MRRKKIIYNDVHSLFRQNSKTTNQENKTQLGTQECWPVSNINHLKATELRLYADQFRSQNKNVCAFLFACKIIWSQVSPFADEVCGRCCNKLGGTAVPACTNPTPQTHATAWRDSCSTESLATEYSDFLAPRFMTTALNASRTGVLVTAYLCLGRVSPYHLSWHQIRSWMKKLVTTQTTNTTQCHSWTDLVTVDKISLAIFTLHYIDRWVKNESLDRLQIPHNVIRAQI